jgi:tetratricopeptide (TPR) repeat protein
LQQGLHEAVQPAATPLVIAEPQRSMVTHLSRIEGQIERLLQDTAHEVSWRVVETRDVQVALPSGTAIGYHLLLDHKTPRRVVRLETLRLHVTKYPRGWRKRLELADLLYAMGRWTEAVQEYRDVLARNPRQLDIWLRVGQILRLLEQTEEAVAVYRSARDVVSRESTRAYIDGLCAQCEERWLDAMAAFEKAISQEPDNPAHRHALASLYLQVHRVADALAIYDALLAQNPDDMVALVNSWGPLHDLGRWEDMERRLRRALELNPDDILALGALGSLRVEQGLLTGSEGKETEKLLQRAVRIAPEAADALFRLATLYLRRGEASRALVMARTFLEAHLQSSHAWYYYAMLLAMQSEHDEAADAMLYAYALSPTNQYICGRTCVCLQEAQRLEELRRVAEEVVARFPQNWHLLMTAAQAYVDVLQDPATGMRLSERAIAIQPEFPVCWLYHAKLLMAQRHFDKAIAALHEGWAHVTPQCASAVATEMAFTLGLCYRDMEDHTLAREWFQRARECALEMKASSKVSWLHKAQQALDTDPASGG